MDLFGGIANFLTGGLGSKIVDTVVGQFPDKLSEKDKENIKVAVIEATRAHEKEQIIEYNKRISDMEGTAKDLQQFGWLGRCVVFLRGSQRPVWGYCVLGMDAMVFSGKWVLTGEKLESAFWVINFLVLGFLFGERAMKNVMPLIKGMNNGK